MITAPFEVPYSFITDTNGNGAFRHQFANDYWYQTVISGVGLGNMIWTLNRNGAFLRPALGNAVVLNAGVCAPGTRLDLLITGATPGSTISGIIGGNKNIDPSALTVLAVDHNTTFTQFQTIAAIPTLVATETFVSTTIATKQYTMPAGTNTLEFTNNFGSQPTITYLVKGVNSGITYYFTLGTSDAGNVVTVQITDPRDLVTANGVSVQYILGAGGTTQTITIQAFGLPQSSPLLWQSPNAGNGFGSASIAAGGQLTLISAPTAPLITRLFSLNLDIIGAANSFFDLQTTPGNNNIGYRFDASFTRSVSVQFYGRSIGTQGVQIVNGGIGASGPINYGIEFSQ